VLKGLPITIHTIVFVEDLVMEAPATGQSKSSAAPQCYFPPPTPPESDRDYDSYSSRATTPATSPNKEEATRAFGGAVNAAPAKKPAKKPSPLAAIHAKYGIVLKSPDATIRKAASDYAALSPLACPATADDERSPSPAAGPQSATASLAKDTPPSTPLPPRAPTHPPPPPTPAPTLPGWLFCHCAR